MSLLLSLVLALQARAADPGVVWKPGFGLEALWNDGNAEVSVYDARDARYGTLRSSRAVLVVVAEDLRRATLVKADHPESGDVVRVLKLNHVRSIPTGVYTYQQMLSAFLGAGRLDPVKLTVASHEWCGNTFVEWRRDRPAVTIRTYFEDPGDVDAPFEAGDAVFYDTLPLKLRGLDFDRTREGRLTIVDSLFASHPAPPVKADARVTVSRVAGTPGGWRVALERGDKRDVLEFESAFPHRLRRWSRSDGGSLELVSSSRFRYWEKNGPGDERFLFAPGQR